MNFPADFPVSEYEARLANIQTLMTAAGLDAVWATAETEFAYFTGFRTPFWQSPTRPWNLIIPQSGLPLAVVPGIGEAPLKRSFVAEVRTWSSPHPTDDGVSLLTDALKPYERVGVLKGGETFLRYPLNDYERILAARQGRAFDDATGLVRACRLVKSPAETALIRRACQTGSAAFARVPALLSQGIKRGINGGMSVAGAFRTFKREVLAQGADDVAFLVGASEQHGGIGGYGDIISPPSGKPVRPGDLFMMDLGATHRGYFCDFNRNFSIGKPHPETAAAYARLYEATEAALAAAKPGATCADLFYAMDRVLNPAGSANKTASTAGVGRYGHGLGLQLTEFPSLIGHDQTELTPGMVLTIEPSLTFAGGLSMVTEENIAISPTGPEILTERAPKTLPVV